MCSDMDHSFTCKLHHPCLYSPAAEHHLPLDGTHFTVPQRVEGWVDLGGWLHTEIKCRLWELNPDTVTHPSTNRAQRTLTLLIKTNELPLHHLVCTPCEHFCVIAKLILYSVESYLSFGDHPHKSYGSIAM